MCLLFLCLFPVSLPVSGMKGSSMTGSADRAKMFWYIENPTTAAMALRAVCSGIQNKILHTRAPVLGLAGRGRCLPWHSFGLALVLACGR